jgi:pre-60S factor REI1
LITSTQVELKKKQEEAEEGPVNLEKTAVKSLRICLFCNKESEGVKKSLDHMRLVHSFFIPDVDCLINLKGLLSYIAERIHLGALCLQCGRGFANGRSA